MPLNPGNDNDNNDDDDDFAERLAHQCLGQGESHLAVLQPTQVLMMERRLKEIQGKKIKDKAKLGKDKAKQLC